MAALNVAVTLKFQPDDDTAAVIAQILAAVTATNERTQTMATAFETLQDEMQQTRAKVDALVAGLADLRSQLAANQANGLTPDQVAALVQLADDTQAAADAGLGGAATPGAPEAT